MSGIDRSVPLHGLLLIWTDIDPAFEDDFNRWYVREHLGERMAIPGFEVARRFVALNGSPRYLALYRTSSLAVFRSNAYRDAFANQSDWSRRTFARMRNTVRCVGEIAARSVDAEGAFLALCRISAGRLPDSAAFDAAASADNVVSAWLVVPDPELSVPLNGASAGAPSGPMVVVEGSDASAVEAATRTLARESGADAEPLVVFRHLCSLGMRSAKRE